jgi:alkyl sulfatase BDS1-like metallo-beta-lactamase superfamily hydrolase
MTTTPERKPASASTKSRNAAMAAYVAARPNGDYELATRGLIAPFTERVIKGRFDHDVWSLDAYNFFNDYDVAPDTVNPSLWRQGALNNFAGLFEVAPGIYQVRGLDISNITFIAGTTGWVVIDPLTGTETAAASLAMVNAHVGQRPVTGVIYSHSHTDHFGGVEGVLTAEQLSSGSVPILAPEGFVREVVSENVLAGTVMLRRAMYMYGGLLPKDPQGHVDSGLGKTLPAMPIVSMHPPTMEVTETGQEVTIDGVRMVFQLTPGTEAPSEMNIYLPDLRAFCAAENCTANQHNIYTLRGAQVRDALGWSKYIDETMSLYAGDIDVLFASHHWPRWGQADIAAYLASQRDAYRYVHDQTLRLANHGLTMNEIAEALTLPAALDDEFFNHGYYGTVSHNAKAVYQRYLGWFDGNPAHLHPHPPVAAGTRYVDFMGGAEAVLDKARESFAAGDYRWVCEVVNHVVFADPENEAARLLQADALEQLGYQAESGPWRDFYLTGAQELRANGNLFRGVKANAMGTNMVRGMSPDLLIDLMGVRLNGPATQELDLRVNLVITDASDPEWYFGVRHGVIHGRAGYATDVDVTLRATTIQFASFANGSKTVDELVALGDFTVTGDQSKLDALAAGMDDFSFGFDIVLP